MAAAPSGSTSLSTSLARGIGKALGMDMGGGGGVAEESQSGAESDEEAGGKSASSNSSICDMPLPPGVHAGETKRVCTVCLEHYVDGDKVRVLPCHHRCVLLALVPKHLHHLHPCLVLRDQTMTCMLAAHTPCFTHKPCSGSPVVAVG